MSPSSSIRDFAQHAGRFLWPRSTADLTDTSLCPACRTALPSAVCGSCGLDLRHPAAADLLAASTDAATALEKRVQLIGRIRYEVAEAEATARAEALERAAERAGLAEQAAAERHADAGRAAATAAAAEAERAAARAATAAAASITAALAAVPATRTAPAPVAPTSTALSAPVASQPAPAGPAVPTTPPPTLTAPESTGPGAATPHKRSGVQIVLLLVGVTLVSVAAVFFLTVAWIFTGLAFRSSVVAVFTLGTLVTAVLLRKRRLVATAEGIGALAVVLVLLDTWALRQNNLFGLGEGDALLYWGASLAVCTVLFLAWHAVSSLRVASVAGFAAAAPAVGLIAAGVAADAAPLTRLFVAAAGAAAGALIHRFTVPGPAGFWPALDRRTERTGLLTVATLALLTAAGLAGAIEPATAWAPLLGFGVIAVLGVAHALTALSPARPDAAARAASHGFVALSVLAAVLGVVVCTGRTDSVDLMVSAPLLVAAVLALGLERAWRRASAARRPGLTGAVTAASLAALLGVVVVGFAAIPLVRALVATGTELIAPTESDSVSALAALAGVAVLAAGFWRVGGVLAARSPLLAWFGLVVALLAVSFAQWLWLVLPLYLLLGALALGALFLARTPRLSLGRFRPQVVTLLAAAEGLGYAISWTGSSSWWLGTVSAVVVLVLARLLLNPGTGAAGRGALLSGAAVLTLAGVAAAPFALTRAAPPTIAVLVLHTVLALAVATGALQLLVAQGRLGRLSPTERRWGFWTLLAPTLYIVAAPTGRLLEALPAADRPALAALAPAAGILAPALVAAATLLWTLRPVPRVRWERLTAALLVAPALYALATNLVLLTDAPASLTRLTAPAATLIAVSLALALRVTGRSHRAGLGLEIGAAVVLASAFLGLDRGELGWLVLLITAVAVLIVAVDADGLFASGSWRRHLGWVSLVLATAGLWWGLANSGTTPVEAYVLPLAGTVLALAALLWRYGRVDRRVAASPGAALLTLAGLCVALVPLALTGQTGSVLRPVLVATSAVVLLLGATLVRWTGPRWAFLAAAGLAGALGLAVTGVGRSVRVLTGGGPAGPLLEAWLLPTTLILAAAAVLLVRQGHAPSRRGRQRAGLSLMLGALVLLTFGEAIAFDGSSLGAARAIALVLLLGGLHVLALLRPVVPLGVGTAWSSAALAALAAAAAMATGAANPFEVVLVPVGLALVVGQLLVTRPWSAGAGRSAPAAQSWIVLGLAVALLPSAAAAAGPGAATLAVGPLTGDALRQLLTLALGGVLAAAGALLLRRPRWNLIAWPGVLVGAAAIVLTATGRISPLLTATRGPDGRLEAWLLPAAMLLIGVGGLVIRAFPVAAASTDAAPGATPPGTSGAPRGFGYGLVLLALLGILLAETTALAYPPYAAGRALALIGVFAALHVLVLWLDRSRAGGLLAVFSVLAGAMALVAGLGRDLVTPIEWGTVPLGLALVAGQLVAARITGPAGARRARGRALPAWLGVGLAVALLPSVVEGWSGDPLRAVVTLTAGGLLTLGAAVLLIRPRGNRWSALAWPGITVGGPAVVLTACGRIVPLLATTPAGPSWRLEAWLLPAALLLVGAGALVIGRGRPAGVRPTPAPDGTGGPTAAPGDRERVLGYGLVLLALVGILWAEVGALEYPPYAEGRAVALLLLFAALHLAVRWIDRSAPGVVLAWFAIAAGLIAFALGRRLDLPTPLELGSVPLGLSLAVGQLVALGVIGRRQGRPGDTAPSRLSAQAWLTGGLAVAVLPSAFGAADGELIRPVLSLSLGGALAVLGALLVRRPHWNVLAWPAAAVGVTAVLVTAGARIVPLYAGPSGPLGSLEAWLLPAAGLLVATGACLVFTTRSTAAAGGTAARIRRPETAGYGLVILALAGVVLAELPALGYAPLATIRVVLIVWTFSALYLGAFWADPSPLGRLVAWVALGGAASLVAAGWAMAVPDPVEIVSIPLALALVASGLLHLERSPTAGSWRTLAPGLLVLLVPSLVLDLSFSPLWRVVGLGVLAIVVLLIGTGRRLQAPFLIGAVVLVVHGLAQLWPWISLTYDAVPWWLWLGVGGVLLIVLAARYERRIQNLKSVALKISALR
jgi:hypothetical protein